MFHKKGDIDMDITPQMRQKFRDLAQSLASSFSLSLCLSHTHTQTQTQTPLSSTSLEDKCKLPQNDIKRLYDITQEELFEYVIRETYLIYIVMLFH